jgi:hypothetical protein
MIFVKQITKNKFFEIQATIFKFEPWFNFELSTHYRSFGDHPGFYFSLAISKLWFEINFYDGRHEDDEPVFYTCVEDEDK